MWYGAEPPGARRGRRPSPALTLGTLSDQWHKLLDLYYAWKISADGFEEEEDRLCTDIEIARTQAAEEQSVERAKNDLEARFEQVAAIPSGTPDIEAVWSVAEYQEKRVLVEELLEWVTVFPDHLEVTVIGAPALNILYGEIGLKVPEIVSIGPPT